MNLYLAGNDNMHFALVLRALRYPYRLASYYYMKSDSLRQRVLDCSNVDDGAEWMLDSGLFSLMFGAEQGTLTTFEDFRNYAEQYVADVKAWGWKHRIVECDIQRVLGVKETHRLRDEVFRPSGLHTIYVWHIPEGEAGLAKLAREERSIALSVPELRKVAGGAVGGGGAVKKMLIRLLSIIRDNGNPRVHLLGNTERGLIDMPAESGDSTSWLAGGRYGEGYIYDAATRSARTVSTSSPKWAAWRAYCERAYAPAFARLHESLEPLVNDELEKKKRWHSYLGTALCCAISFLLWMEANNGIDYAAVRDGRAQLKLG